MNKVMRYQTDDGAEFETEEDAIHHEKSLRIYRLFNNTTTHAGLTDLETAAIIVVHKFDEILRIMGSQNEYLYGDIMKLMNEINCRLEPGVVNNHLKWAHDKLVEILGRS